MIWSSPSITPANAYQSYLGGFGGSPNHTSSWQSYEGTSADTNQFENCFFHDGLPDSSCVPSSPHALGEPPVCNRISPTTTYSSFSSSAPTEAMGSLSFDTINETMGTPDVFRGILNLPTLVHTENVTNMTTLSRISGSLQADGSR